MSYADYTDKPATKCAWWISGDWADIGCYTPDSCGHDPVNCDMPIIPMNQTDGGIVYETAAAEEYYGEEYYGEEYSADSGAVSFDTTEMSSGYKTAIIIDDEKLTYAAEETAQAIQGEVFSPDGQQIADALEKEFNKAAIKVDMSANKILSPVLQIATKELDMETLNKDCDVHGLYQCLVDYTTAKGNYLRPYNWDWRLEQSGCQATTGCSIKIDQPDFSWSAHDDEIYPLQDEFEAAAKSTFEPMQQDLMAAAMEQQVAAANIAKNFGESAKSILINYGCDATCLDSVPMDIISVAQAATYCDCPASVTITSVDPENLRKRQAPVKNILKKLGVPKHGSAI